MFVCILGKYVFKVILSCITHTQNVQRQKKRGKKAWKILMNLAEVLVWHTHSPCMLQQQISMSIGELIQWQRHRLSTVYGTVKWLHSNNETHNMYDLYHCEFTLTLSLLLSCYNVYLSLGPAWLMYMLNWWQTSQHATNKIVCRNGELARGVGLKFFWFLLIFLLLVFCKIAAESTNTWTMQKIKSSASNIFLKWHPETK